MEFETDCQLHKHISEQFNLMIEQMHLDIIKSVQESIRIDSTAGVPTETMPFGEGPAKALQHALKLAQSLGFRTKNLNNAVGYAEFGSGDEMIAVLGHLDVVPAGDGWQHPPFAAEISDDTLWGRGTLDNKGPIIGALYALKAIEQSGLKTTRRIRVIFGTNEETGSKDMPYYCNTQEAPVMGFTPDASYPVIFAEKGILTLSLSKKLDQTNGSIKLLKLSGGTVANIVPNTAEAFISHENGLESKYEGFGLASHGSKPELGQNAVIDLLKKLCDIDFPSDLKQFFTFLLEKIGEETDGASMGIRMMDEKSGCLTLNLATIGLTEADGCQEINAKINIRYPVTKDGNHIIQTIKDHTDKTGIQLTTLTHKEPLYINENSELIKKLQYAYEHCTGEKASPAAIGGGTYAKAIKNIAAYGPLFPGQEDVTHQAEEHTTIENLMKNIKIMATAMYILSN